MLTKLLHGPSSERITPTNEHPQQSILFPELVELKRKVEEQTASLASNAGPSKAPRAPSKRRDKFPEHLPRVRTVIELPADQRHCSCGAELVAMKGDVTQELERIEIVYVHEIERKKYICRTCQEGVRIADAPARIIDKGLLGRDALAWLATERFFNHMPYHRLERKLHSEGVDVSRSLMCESIGTCAELLEPILAQLLVELKDQPVVHSDDTQVTIQQSARGGPRTGYVWTYCDRAGRVFYDFTESRNRDGPLKVMAGFCGYLQVDACGLYDHLFAAKATEAGCMAHARRKFVDAEATDKVLAGEALQLFGRLYKIEQEAKELSLHDRELLEVRQRLAVPALNDLFDWLTVTKTKVLDKSPMGKAIQYALNQEKNLRRYVESAALDIDNNVPERNLRAIAVGRKNWIFVGNEDYGAKAAVLFSLIMTCHNLGIDPSLYLRDVLMRISLTSDVKSLTPHAWKDRWLAEATRDRDEARAKVLSLLAR